MHQDIYDSFNNIPEQVISDEIDSYQGFFTFIHRDNGLKTNTKFYNENELFTNFTSKIENSKTKKINDCTSENFYDLKHLKMIFILCQNMVNIKNLKQMFW